MSDITLFVEDILAAMQRIEEAYHATNQLLERAHRPRNV